MRASLILPLVATILIASNVGAFAPLPAAQRRLYTGTTVTTRTMLSLVDSRLYSSISEEATPATALETWCVSRLDDLYTRSITIKCPFFRRRAADALDSLDMVLRFLIIRHKSLGLLPPLGCRATTVTSLKHTNLPLSTIQQTIQKDWHEHNLKGYYITGRLNTTIYRDDCLFDGPDPDMPVKGLRKYLASASQLFDVAQSESELRSLRIGDEPNTIVATWRMAGVLRLPWRPSLPTMTGSTTYHLDDDGLIYRHIETWDMSVEEAFLKTFYQALGDQIWDRECIQRRQTELQDRL
jgi:hypothetical protein